MIPSIRPTLTLLALLALMVSNTGCASVAGYAIGSASEPRHRVAVPVAVRTAEAIRSGERVMLSVHGAKARVSLHFSHLDRRAEDLVGYQEGKEIRIPLESIDSIRVARSRWVTANNGHAWEGLALGLIVDSVIAMVAIRAWAEGFSLGR